MQNPHTGCLNGERPYDSQAFGGSQRTDKMQGHWVLARAGKRVLRPGGLYLTQKMLDAMAIGPQDRVVEFAPGLGVTARMVLEYGPCAYCGVEREPAAVKQLQRELDANRARIVLASADQSGLPDSEATVVYGEAMLSMQTPGQKDRIIEEAFRILAPGGRYAIHELCLLPDGVSERVRHEIQAAMSREIHVGVQPLTREEWVKTLERHGFGVTWSCETPMHLLEPRQVLRDEGLMGGLRICFKMATDRTVRGRIRSMRRLFSKYEDHLGAISLVGLRKSLALASNAL